MENTELVQNAVENAIETVESNLDQASDLPVDDGGFEEDARSMGWQEREKFRGNPEDWVDAKTFVSRGKTFLPFLKKENQRLETEVSYLKNEVKDIRESANEYRRFLEEAHQRRLQNEVLMLRRAKVKAQEDQDFSRADQIDVKINELSRVQAQPVEAAQPPLPPETITAFQGWLNENKWYEADTTLREVANSIGAELRNTTSLTNDSFFDAVGRRVKQLYPEKFPQRRIPGQMVEGSSRHRPTNGSGGKRYEDLPPEDKAVCDKLVKDRLFSSREDFVKEYPW